jgi:hypothetical protein
VDLRRSEAPGSKHQNGEISRVTISEAEMGHKRVRVAFLPPEVPDTVVAAALAPFGTIVDIREEEWSRTYRYVV